MTGKPACQSWNLLFLLTLALLTGCAHKSATTGANCYAKAVPTAGEGGLAWGSSLSIAKQKSLNNCIRYAGRSGGTPSTCQVVLAECKK
ncbi:hypothetical protein ACQKP5_18635 [Pseudomonas vancouverensis]|uniref:hypothetical protein n=1 Tax=Pseudomonas vancouverensis TaxID=95300 RepID=UPI003D0613EB